MAVLNATAARRSPSLASSLDWCAPDGDASACTVQYMRTLWSAVHQTHMAIVVQLLEVLVAGQRFRHIAKGLSSHWTPVCALPVPPINAGRERWISGQSSRLSACEGGAFSLGSAGGLLRPVRHASVKEKAWDSGRSFQG